MCAICVCIQRHFAVYLHKYSHIGTYYIYIQNYILPHKHHTTHLQVSFLSHMKFQCAGHFLGRNYAITNFIDVLRPCFNIWCTEWCFNLYVCVSVWATQQVYNICIYSLCVFSARKRFSHCDITMWMRRRTLATNNTLKTHSTKFYPRISYIIILNNNSTTYRATPHLR